MIIAKSFIESDKSRAVEFSTNEDDTPLVVQFAANHATELAQAAELIADSASGVDLNCGCPQRWAMADHYGSYLISHPELVADMVKQTRSRISDPSFSISIKIRISEDERNTVDLCQKAEAAGCSYITVHARTPLERHQPTHNEMYRTVKQSVRVPVVANGDVFKLGDAERIVGDFGVDGVMVARGLLQNPALFTGETETPDQCIIDWIKIAMDLKLKFTEFQKLTLWMIEKRLTKPMKVAICNTKSHAQLFPLLKSYLNFDYIDNYIDC